MSLHIKSHLREGILILSADGRITAQESGTLRKAMDDALAQQQIRVVLDLGPTDYIDSTGLGAMMIWYNQLKKAGGALKLLKVNRRNVELLALTKLHTVFEVFTEEQDAVNSFFSGREVRHFDILKFVSEQQT
jgi:anti-sigma B factor antagonist